MNKNRENHGISAIDKQSISTLHIFCTMISNFNSRFLLRNKYYLWLRIWNIMVLRVNISLNWRKNYSFLFIYIFYFSVILTIQACGGMVIVFFIPLFVLIVLFLYKIRKDGEDGIFLYIRTVLFLLSGICLNHIIFYCYLIDPNVYLGSLFVSWIVYSDDNYLLV